MRQREHARKRAPVARDPAGAQGVRQQADDRHRSVWHRELAFVTPTGNHGTWTGQALYKGRYFTQLLASVARVAAHELPTIKAALLGGSAGVASLHTAVADIRATDRTGMDKFSLEGADEAERLWRQIAVSLGVDLSQPFVPPVQASRCGNPTCSTPDSAPSLCAGCSKSSSPQRYCGASECGRHGADPPGASCQRGALLELDVRLTVFSRLEAAQARLRRQEDPVSLISSTQTRIHARSLDDSDCS